MKYFGDYLKEATRNPEWGFYGTLIQSLYDYDKHGKKPPKEAKVAADELYAHAEEVYMRVWKSGKTNAVKALDNTQGRHFADHILHKFYQVHQNKTQQDAEGDWYLDPTDKETIKILKSSIESNLKKMIKPI